MTRLLDVNVVMAVLWENHEPHERARRWLKTLTEFATCPVSQLGFARISSHPLLGYGMLPEQAFGVLRKFLADSRHRFVPDDCPGARMPSGVEWTWSGRRWPEGMSVQKE